MMITKTALVLQGGGTRAAFTAGVVDVILENNIVFPYLSGVSAGGLMGVNYLSRQAGRSKYIVTKLMRDKKFVSLNNFLFKKSAFDFHYLLEEVPKFLKFDRETYDNSKTELVVTATSMEDGKAHAFKKSQCANFNAALAASASLPLLSQPVEVDGHLYLDGGPSCSIGFRSPLEDGFEKIVVVCTRHKGYRKTGEVSHMGLAKRFYGNYPAFMDTFAHSKMIYNADMQELERLAEEGKAFIIYPEEPIEIGRTETKYKVLAALYDKGYALGKKILPDLLEFLDE